MLAAVDLLEQMATPPFPVGVAGVGEGALLALYAGALDPRIRSVWVSGYYAEREQLWREPIYRNVWGLLTEFGDAELAGMIAPRRLVIEASGGIEVTGPPPVREGRRAAAAPGRIERNRLESVRAEFARGETFYKQLDKAAEMILAVSGSDGAGPAGTTEGLQAFAAGLGVRTGTAVKLRTLALPDAAERERRLFDEAQSHVQGLLRVSHRVRDARWRRDHTSVESWLAERGRLRDWVHEELIGRFEEARGAPNPRSRLVLETDQYTGYEVLLDVTGDVIASGILLLPRGLRQGEKRPVVVCQHGLESTPMDTIARTPREYATYKAFSEELVRRGFIVYAPQNPYRGGDRFRSIQRKANPLKLSLFSFIVAQHEQTLDWLQALPFVDRERIGFYGISYGGKTAMRVPPLVERYALSICSGDFTEWARVIATNEERYGYSFTGEYEVPEWNLGHVADYAELAMLISPRPFLVEEGHRDAGQPTEWTMSQYGKVLRHYDLMGIGERIGIDLFDGPHTIHGEASFRFLHRRLRWPERR